MKNPIEVLRQKQLEAERLHKEIVCLQIIIPLLRDDEEKWPEEPGYLVTDGNLKFNPVKMP